MACALSISRKVSPRTPAVSNEVTESRRKLKPYFVLTFMVISTGVRGLSRTMAIFVTLPISTPLRRTGAPTRNPSALSKYDLMVIRGVNSPAVPDIRKSKTPSVTLATMTVIPTLS